MLQTKIIPCTEAKLADGSFEQEINDFLKEHGSQLMEKGMMTFADKAVFYYDPEYVEPEKVVAPEEGSLEDKKGYIDDQLKNAKKLLTVAEWHFEVQAFDHDDLSGLSKAKQEAKLASYEASKEAVADRKKEVALFEAIMSKVNADIADRDSKLGSANTAPQE